MSTTAAAMATVSKHLPLDNYGLLDLDLRPGLRRLLVSVKLVRRADVRRFPRMRSATDVYREFRSLADLDREVVIALLLDNKHRCIGINVVSVGVVNGAPVHPRETFKAAVLASASAIILLHNHPSGDPTPSAEDRELTERMKEAGIVLGIPLLDHVVVGVEGFYSFQDSGLLR